MEAAEIPLDTLGAGLTNVLEEIVAPRVLYKPGRG